MESFNFSSKLIQPKDSIRVIITTFPGDQSQAIMIDSKKIKEERPVITVRINERTKKIILVFRKKNNFNKKDFIFASTIIRSNQFPNKINDKYNSEMRLIPVYEPFPKNFTNRQSILENRKILGKLEVQLAISELTQ